MANKSNASSIELNKLLTDISIKFSYSISLIGSVFGLICIVVFVCMIRTSPSRCSSKNLNNKSIKFLLLKSGVECLLNMNRFFLQCTECSQCLLSTCYPFVYFRLILNNYAALTYSVMSIETEIFVNLDRLMSIIDHKKYSKYLNFNYSVALIVTYPGLFYIFKFFDTYIEPSVEKTTNITYYLIKTSTDPIYDYLKLIHSIVRDVIFVSMVFITNILLLYYFRTLLKRKKAIQLNMSVGGGSKRKSEIESSKRENNLTIMMIIMGFTCIVGHIPIFIRYIPIHAVKTLIDTTDWFVKLAEDFFYVSTAFNFFLYFVFDLKFRMKCLSFFGKGRHKNSSLNESTQGSA